MTSVYGEIHQCETTATAIMTTISQNKTDNIQPTNRASAGKASTRRNNQDEMHGANADLIRLHDAGDSPVSRAT
jgi:hypothetical protein